MHTLPNSRFTRKYLPHATYFTMMRTQRLRSFIGLSLKQVPQEQIQQRILELAKLEKKGFLYLAERNWLDTFLTTGIDNYANWLRINFSNYLNIDFKIDTEYPNPENGYKVWKAEMKASHLLLDFKKLQHKAFQRPEYLDIFVLGSETRVSDIHLVQVFEFLHSFEYYLSIFPPKKQQRKVLSITGIDVTNTVHPSYWNLNVMSEYGSEWDELLINGFAWRTS